MRKTKTTKRKVAAPAVTATPEPAPLAVPQAAIAADKPFRLPVGSVQVAAAEHHYRNWFIDLAAMRVPPPRPVGLADLFQPSFWINVADKLSVNDVLRVRAADRSFDILVTVTGKAGWGVEIAPFNLPSDAVRGELLALAEASREQRAPFGDIRVAKLNGAA